MNIIIIINYIQMDVGIKVKALWTILYSNLHKELL